MYVPLYIDPLYPMYAVLAYFRQSFSEHCSAFSDQCTSYHFLKVHLLASCNKSSFFLSASTFLLDVINFTNLLDTYHMLDCGDITKNEMRSYTASLRANLFVKS